MAGVSSNLALSLSSYEVVYTRSVKLLFNTLCNVPEPYTLSQFYFIPSVYI